MIVSLASSVVRSSACLATPNVSKKTYQTVPNNTLLPGPAYPLSVRKMASSASPNFWVNYVHTRFHRRLVQCLLEVVRRKRACVENATANTRIVTLARVTTWLLNNRRSISG